MTGRPQFHPLRVSLIERLTPDAVALTFEVPAELAADYQFGAGQHVTVRCIAAGDDTRRTYSLCGPPGVLRIAVKRIATGVFSAYALERARVGDEVEVMTPTGRFTPSFDGTTGRHRVAIAAGSGITPVMSMLYATLAAEPASRFSLIYGNRDAASVMFLDELADLKDRYPDRLAVFHVFSREPRESALLSGRLDESHVGAFLDTLVDPGTVDEWFLCGPIPMVESARAVLRGRGVLDSVVKSELFHLATAAPQADIVPGDEASTDAADVTVRLGGRTTSVRVSRDGDVLHALLPVRPDVPYGCTNGMCGTCRARVVEGKVEMRHCYALDEEDLAQGFVVTCQAMPRSDRVELDYDA